MITQVESDWCEDFGDVIVCGTDMVEYHRESIGTRWCFLHRTREEFFWVCYKPTGLSYYGPSGSYEGPSSECRDLFPGWYREAGEE